MRANFVAGADSVLMTETGAERLSRHLPGLMELCGSAGVSRSPLRGTRSAPARTVRDACKVTQEYA
jgi:hypothetical protein